MHGLWPPTADNAWLLRLIRWQFFERRESLRRDESVRATVAADGATLNELGPACGLRAEDVRRGGPTPGDAVYSRLRSAGVDGGAASSKAAAPAATLLPT